jgi:cytochrome c oxidase cbb3-type subunit 2
MPSFADSIDEADRWALAYYVLSLSAWLDPLTGEPLDLPPAARAALRAPPVTADSPATAWSPGAAAGRGRHHRRMTE